MSMSGVQLQDEVKLQYNNNFCNVNRDNVHTRPRYFVLKIEKNEETGKQEIMIEKKGPPRCPKEGEGQCCKDAFDEMSACFQPGQGRYVLFDVGEKEPCKTVLITWAPDSATIKEKMLYASTKCAITDLVKNAIVIQGSDLCDVNYDEICDKVAKSGSCKK